MKTRTLTRIAKIIEEKQSDLLASKRQLRRIESIELVRNNRDEHTQTYGFAPRPFVMCNFPHKQPSNPAARYERFNGDFVLRILPDPVLGVPFGKDRIWPIYLSTMAVRQA